jgi:membrane protease YdiL (CAAX protease family)
LSSRVFYNDAGALRAPWRIVFFCVVSLASLIVVESIVGPAIALLFPSVGLRGVANEEWVWCLTFLLSTAICLRHIDKRPWRDVWLGADASKPTKLGFGFAVGALAIAIPIGTLIGAQWLRAEPGPPGSWWGATVRVSVVLLPAALFEELLTRGYILSVLSESWGKTWAVVATSLGFGFMHLMNPGAKMIDVGLVTLAGFFLAGVLLATRSLYAAWMAHFAWNWTMAVIFHTAVSGLPMERPNYRYVDAGPDWATGGEWGPEGGVPAALGMVAGMGFLFVNRRRARSRRQTEIDQPES